jgi:hypothetical protein
MTEVEVTFPFLVTPAQAGVHGAVGAVAAPFRGAASRFQALFECDMGVVRGVIGKGFGGVRP